MGAQVLGVGPAPVLRPAECVRGPEADPHHVRVGLTARREGDIPPGQVEAIADFGTGPHNSALGTNGDALYLVDLTPSTTTDGVIYLNNTIVAQEGSPSPVAGRTWLTLSSARMDVNRGAAYVHTGTLSGDIATDAVIAATAQSSARKAMHRRASAADGR